LIVRSLQIENLRNLAQVEIGLHPRLNLFHGPNGAGKTSVLEALVVLSRGRSFRTSQASELVGPKGRTFRVFAVTEDGRDATHRLGLERSGRRWRGRKDGADLTQLSQLTRSLPVVLMEPDSHLLVGGAPEMRRKYLDWGMFHVEPAFLEVWRRFQKALKQRNAALRGSDDRVLDAVEPVLAEQGERLDSLRQAHAQAIGARIEAMLTELAPGLSGVALSYHRGWPGEALTEALRMHRARDRERGQTAHGPHRSDLQIVAGKAPARAVLSRGEQKIVAAALVLTQAGLLAGQGERPVLLLDDLASEFDEQHYRAVLAHALASGSQVWVTGTRREMVSDASVFHVEQGTVREVV
jgi:DNA replication and repair protein RecF